MFEFLKIAISNGKNVTCYRNSGLGDNLLQAATAWCYAKNTNRSLFINWTNSVYLKDKSENAFFTFFDVPDTILGVKILKIKKLGFLGRIISIGVLNTIIIVWCEFIIQKLSKSQDNIFNKLRIKYFKHFATHENLIAHQNTRLNQKVVFFRSCLFNFSEEVRPFFDSIKPNSFLANEIENFKLEHFANKKVIGLHIRYYNKNLVKSNHTQFWTNEEKSLDLIDEKLRGAISMVGENDFVIFLSSDSILPVDFIKSNFTNVVMYTKKFGKDISKELHQELPVETANASIIEMFLLAESDILIRYPPNSWFSYYASLYAQKIVV